MVKTMKKDRKNFNNKNLWHKYTIQFPYFEAVMMNVIIFAETSLSIKK